MARHSITFIDDGTRVEIRFAGQLEAASALSAVFELKSDPRYPGVTGVLWDLTDADLSVITIDVYRTIFTEQTTMPTARSLRIAKLVSGAFDGHILNLWAEGFGDAVGHRRRWFTDRARALAWLRSEADAGPDRPAPPPR